MANEITSQSSERPRARWSLLVAFIVSGIFLALAIRGVRWSEIAATLGQVGLTPILAAIPIMTASYLLRGFRWSILLRAEAPVPSRVAVCASVVGYLANGYLPARAGEPIRALLVSQHSRVSASGALATALTERVVDAALLTLIAISAVATASHLPDWLRGGAWTMAGVVMLCLVGLFVAPRFQPLLDRGIRRLPLSARWTERLSRFIEQFLQGLRALHSPKRALSFVAITLVIWSIDTVCAMVIARGVHFSLSIFHALTLLAALGLASAAPSTPGYVGIYQFVAVSVLEPFGVTKSEALVFIVAFQVVVYVIITVGGALGLYALAKDRASMSA